ncbi:MAG TPA: hypothetical protein VLA43_15440, partial [Longimicrobiales bacterium]|nr:hypothetical protein [Longimicrobiales bacterium]
MSRRGVVRRAALTLLSVPALLVPADAFAQGPQAGGPGARRPDPLPLAAARKATFTATEATWMSVDVSPDGRQIVFDLLGDLYLLPVEGGKATRITEGMAFDAQPRFSPDGERVVFVSDRSGGDNVWTLRLDFTDTTQVTQGNTASYISPAWMPDGEHVVVSRGAGLGGAAKLVLLDAERNAPMPLITAPPQLKTLGAAPEPNGRYIWYAGGLGDWQYNALFPRYQLFRYDRETGESTAMTSRYGSAFRPAVSPDGEWLVYGTRENAETGLRKRNLRTGDEAWLAYPVQRDETESRAPLDLLPGYAFTPDSEAIVVSYGGKLWRVPMDGSDAAEIPFEAAVEVPVGPEVKFDYPIPDDSLVVAKQIRSPAASPDGRWMAFTAFDRVWVKAVPDGEPRRLSAAANPAGDVAGGAGEYHPVWSPDGAWVAYVSWEDAQGGHIWKARADGAGQP